MQIAEFQSVDGVRSSDGSSIAFTFANPSAGAEVRLHVLGSPGTATITDSQGNSYVPVGSPHVSLGAGTHFDFECAAVQAGASLVVTVTGPNLQSGYARLITESAPPIPVQSDALTSIATSLETALPLLQQISKAQIFDARHA